MSDSTIRFDYCEIALTEACNSRCIMCRKHQMALRSSDSFIPMSRWELFFTELRTYAAEHCDVRFFTGEALLHPHFFDLLSIIKAKDFPVGLLSNGLLITRDKAEQLVKRGLNGIRISLESNQPGINDQLRGIAGAFARSHQALQDLHEFKAALGAHLKIGVQTVISKINLPGLIDFILWIQEQEYIDIIGLNLLRQPLESPPDPYWFKKKQYVHLWPDTSSVDACIDELCRLIELGVVTKVTSPCEQLKKIKTYYANPLSILTADKRCGYERRIAISDVGEILFCHYYEAVGSIVTQRLSEVMLNPHTCHINTKITQCPIKSCCFFLSLDEKGNPHIL